MLKPGTRDISDSQRIEARLISFRFKDVEKP